MSRVPVPRITALIAVLVALASCGKPPESRLSGLLITLDTTNTFTLGCYVGREGFTTHLDRLAAEGVLYENARTVAPITLPAHASMLTGLYPIRHGVRDNARRPLSGSARTLAELAREKGIRTGAFVAAVVLAEPYGLAQGFERYDEPAAQQGGPELKMLERPAAVVTDAALDWLEQLGPDERFFLWVHYFDLHAPYVAEPAHLEKAARFRAPAPHYTAQVLAVDEQVGRLLDALGTRSLLDDTLIVVAGDHGEGLNRHDEPTHSTFIYDTTMQVPMLVRHPDGHRAGERSREVVSVTDVFPTFVEGLGLESQDEPDQLDGLSLFLRPVPADRGVYFESFSAYLGHGWSPLSGWADADGVYLHSSEPELYLATDVRQQENLATARTDLASAARQAIETLAAKPRLERPEEGVDAALRAQARELGYLGGGDDSKAAIHPLAVDGLIAPRTRIRTLHVLNDSQLKAADGKLEEAIADLRELLAEEPDDPVVLEALATFHGVAGQQQELVELLWQRRIGLAERWNCVTLLAGALERVERMEDALTVYQAARVHWPLDRSFVEGAIRCLERLDRSAEAERLRREAVGGP